MMMKKITRMRMKMRIGNKVLSEIGQKVKEILSK